MCLVIIIIACSVAIWFLLREGTSPDEEAARRRNQYQQHSMPIPSNFLLPTNTQKQWLPRFPGFFNGPHTSDNTRSGPARAMVGRGVGQGWMQTGSRDEWYPHLQDDRQPARAEEERLTRPRETYERRARVMECPSPTNTAPSSYPTSDSISSVRFDLQAVRGLPYHDNFAPSPQPTLQGLHVQYSSPVSSGAPSPLPIRSTSPEPISLGLDSQTEAGETHHSMQSAMSRRTFEGGTKFIEAL